jgi:hypothetical protein
VQYLQGDGPPLLARMYVSWTGAASTASALAQVQELAGIPWDLVLCYRDPAGDVEGWAGFAADVVRGHGHQLAAIQVTGEANLTGIPELNVTHWELFTLRDADSTRDSLFHQFGVLRDDYSPKPAFERLRGLFRELR